MSRPLSFLVLLLGLAPLFNPAVAVQAPRRNVLLLSIDDLRPSLGCMDDELAQTPHIDRLAARGVLFDRHYCQQALCNPSRSSLLTGKRPRSIRVTDLGSSYRAKNPDIVTLPQRLRAEGYRCLAIGKVHHSAKVNDPLSWSGPVLRGANRHYRTEASLQAIEERRAWMEQQGLGAFGARGPAWEAPDLPGDELLDGVIASDAIRTLEDLARREGPFFLAVGFLKPHLPFVAPEECWQRYDPADFDVPLGELPVGAPDFAGLGVGELRAYVGIPREGDLGPALAQKLRHAYYACVSHVDDQVGRVLAALERLGLDDSTTIVLWSDHGFQLGELGQWCKHTNFETAVRSPLIVSVPDGFGPGFERGRSMALVESVDLYPTLLELCGFQPPGDLEGTSFLPLLFDPRRDWKRAAFSEYGRSVEGRRCWGVSVRTEDQRFTLWRSGQKVMAVELYRYGEGLIEPGNLVDQEKLATPDADLGSEVVRMRRLLGEGWRGARRALLAPR